MLFATLAAAVVGYLIAYPPAFPTLSPALHHPSTPRGTLLNLYPPPPLKMARVILTGATGSAGSEALRQLLRHPAVDQVTVLSRRALPPHVAPDPPSSKLRVVLHDNFLVYSPALLAQLKGYDGVVWDLGCSSMGMNESDYSLIHVDYPLAAARAFATLEPASEPGRNFVFAYLSGQGSSQDPAQGRQMFGRVKGRAEAQLAALATTHPNLAPFSFRPSLINPTSPSPADNIGKKAIYAIVPFLRRVVPVIDADVLARSMIEAVLKGGSGSIARWPGKGDSGDKGTFENEEIEKLASGSALSEKKLDS